MEHKYSRSEFEGYTHRFMIEFKTGTEWPSTVTLYSNSDSYADLEAFINENKSEKVVSFKIIHCASKEQDAIAAKFIDETLSNW